MGLIKKGLSTHLFGHRSTGVDVIIDGRHAAAKVAATLKPPSKRKKQAEIEEAEPAKKRQTRGERQGAQKAQDNRSRLLKERYTESQARGLAWVCTQDDARQHVRDWIYNIGDITATTKYSNGRSLQDNLLSDGFSLSEQEIASFFHMILWEPGMRRCHEARCSHQMPLAESRLKKALLRLTVVLDEPVRTASRHHDGRHAVGSGRRGCHCHSASLQYVYIQSCDHYE